jgi:hypothetical protein
MADIVEQLRNMPYGELLLDEAANEIEKLRIQRDEWKKLHGMCDRARDVFYDQLGEAEAEIKRLQTEIERLRRSSGEA